MDLSLLHKRGKLQGTINLTASKSESNRALIIQALCEDDFTINNLAEAEDTKVLTQLLKRIQPVSDTARAEIDTAKSAENDADNNQPILSVGIAGTAMRFLTAFLAVKKGEWVLTGEERMKERPIKVLVDALRSLGSDIEYIEKEGYPPLKITGKELSGGKIKIDGSISSQYISALLLIAPTLKNGLTIEFEGELISKPYINMTISMMQYFGAELDWKENGVIVQPKKYVGKEITVEADWSSASYWYGFAALAEEADITLLGLKQNSLQGDSAVVDIYKNFGVETQFIENGIRITKNSEFRIQNSELKIDCVNFPDIAQTVAVTCAALNVEAKLTGLKTLRIKETDRITALQIELNKLGFNVEVDGDDLIINPAEKIGWDNVQVKTYNDHRMAMAFAPLALINEISIEDAEVVKKSYPKFWEDLNGLFREF